MRVSKLFLWGQSENISISVKDDIRFGVVFPFTVITSNCNRIKISKVCFGKGFRCHLLIISLSQTVHARNHTKKLANMPAKRKYKKGIAIQTDLNRPNENAVEDLSCTTRVRIKRGYGRTDGWMADGRTDGRMSGGRTDGRTDGRMAFKKRFSAFF